MVISSSAANADWAIVAGAMANATPHASIGSSGNLSPHGRHIVDLVSNMQCSQQNTHQRELGRSVELVVEPKHHCVQRDADFGTCQQGRWRVLVFDHPTPYQQCRRLIAYQHHRTWTPPHQRRRCLRLGQDRDVPYAGIF